jgi:hypothetical protein
MFIMTKDLPEPDPPAKMLSSPRLNPPYNNLSICGHPVDDLSTRVEVPIKHAFGIVPKVHAQVFGQGYLYSIFDQFLNWFKVALFQHVCRLQDSTFKFLALGKTVQTHS